MSVVVQNQSGQYYLLSKGADSTIIKLCSEDNQPYLHQTQRDLTYFSSQGFRTLAFAIKPLYELEVMNLVKAISDLKMDLRLDHDIQQKELEKIYEGFEKELFLLGASALEDKL